MQLPTVAVFLSFVFLGSLSVILPAEPEPLDLRLGRLTLTPSGFAESIAAVRSSTTHDDISTRFGIIPLGESPAEALDSFRNSRIALKAALPLGPGTLGGYVETDFLNRPPQQPYRFRQYFASYTVGDWEFSAGQEWSLLRPNRVGIASRTDLMNTRVVDAGYHVGLLGYRDRQVRVRRTMGAWTAALSYENGRDFVPSLVRDSKRLHWEAKAVASRHHYGGTGSAVIHASKAVNVVVQQSWLQRGGKDALGTVPADVAATASLLGIEVHPTKRLLLYGYAGGVYGARSAGNRLVTEWTGGGSRELQRDHFGVTSIGAQVSHISRALWDGRSGAQTFTMISVRRTLGPG